VAEGLSTPVQASDEHAADAPIAGVALSRPRSERREASPHSHRFRAAIATLVGVAIGAIAVAVVVLATGSKTAVTGKWSDWAPTDSGTLGAREIADHVAPLYRVSSLYQLAVVTVVNLSSPSASASATGTASGLQVAVRPDPSSSAVSLLSGTTMAYNLCGIGGSNCSIGVGTPSAARLLLLRREALELAMYTFRYLSGVDNVVAILPPGHTSSVCTGICPKPNPKATSKPVDIAILFGRDELRPLLQQPLNASLPEEFPPTVDQMASAPEAGLVDQVTARGLFSEQLVQAQDGSNLIVLNPLPPQ
jgi:hypothetical protein